MFLTILYGLLSSIGSFFKVILKILQDNPKLAVALALVGASIFGAYKVDSYLKDLHAQISVAQHAQKLAEEKAELLQKDLNSAVQLNHDNQDIITQMISNKAQDDERVKSLSAAVDDNSKKYSNLLNSIKNTKKEDNGPVAKVLSDTIKSIQLQRGVK